MEVGQAIRVSHRAKDHLENTGTNAMFGFMNAWTRYRCITPFPAPAQFLLFRVWRKDNNLLNMAEIVGSILCSSYWYMGGLNPQMAGGGTFADKDIDDLSFVTNSRLLEDAMYLVRFQSDWDLQVNIHHGLQTLLALPQ